MTTDFDAKVQEILTSDKWTTEKLKELYELFKSAGPPPDATSGDVLLYKAMRLEDQARAVLQDADMQEALRIVMQNNLMIRLGRKNDPSALSMSLIALVLAKTEAGVVEVKREVPVPPPLGEVALNLKLQKPEVRRLIMRAYDKDSEARKLEQDIQEALYFLFISKGVTGEQAQLFYLINNLCAKTIALVLAQQELTAS